MPISSPFLADLILSIHVCYVGVVVLSVPLIILGGLARWKWVHWAGFRLTHLVMIAIVILETITGTRCPLTVWEGSLRHLSTDPQTGSRDFIAVIFDRLLFYHFSPRSFAVIYFLFGASVLALLIWVPIRPNKGVMGLSKRP